MRPGVLLATLCLFSTLATKAAAQAESAATRGAIFAEYYLSEDSDRDIGLLALGATRGVPIGSWLSLLGTVSLVLTNGSRSVEDSTPPLQLNADALGLRFLGSLRVIPLQIGPVMPFGEAGLGMIFTTKDFPPGGTTWNFTQRYGVGLAVRLSDSLSLLAGLVTTHVSNGKGFGHPRNPSYGGTGVLIGVSR